MAVYQLSVYYAFTAATAAAPTRDPSVCLSVGRNLSTALKVGEHTEQEEHLYTWQVRLVGHRHSARNHLPAPL